MQIVTLANAQQFPFWRRPIFLLFIMAIAMPIAFSTWYALLNNFVVEVANFDGVDIGLLHTIREIPGFLAVGVIFVIIFVREQILGLVSLVLLGAATAFTAWFPQISGILTLTMLSSIGFHYYETVNQSLQLQWIPKYRAPQVLGWLLAVGSAASLFAFGCSLYFTLSTVSVTYAPAQDDDLTKAILALLRITVYGWSAPSNFYGFCWLYDGRAIWV